MHIEKLPNGRWRAAVSVNGKRRSVTRRTKGEARHAGAELVIEMGGNPTAHTSTVGELVAGHLAQSADTWSPTTLDDMTRVADRLPDTFADRPLVTITPAVLAGLYRQLTRDGWSPHRIKRAHTLLSVSFRDAVTYGWMRTNPCRDVNPPKIDKADIHAPSDADVRAVLEAAGERFRLFMLVAHCTGARRGEIVALQWDDIDLDTALVRIARSLAQKVGGPAIERNTKTGAKGHRTLPLDLPTSAALRTHRTAQLEASLVNRTPTPVWVFSHDNGQTPWRPDHASRLFRDARSKANVTGVRLHDVRHYVATTMLQDGEALIDVAAQLGHASIATTASTYSSYMPGRGREAADRRAARLTGG